MPEIHSGPKKIGEECSSKCAVPGARRVKTAQISHHSEPVFGIVLKLTTPSLSNVCRRGRNPGDVGIYINACVVVPAVQITLRVPAAP